MNDEKSAGRSWSESLSGELPQCEQKRVRDLDRFREAAIEFTHAGGVAARDSFRFRSSWVRAMRTALFAQMSSITCDTEPPG